MVSSVFSPHKVLFLIFGTRYSTGSNLNTYSALIQNFYSQDTAPHQAIHVALNTGVEEGEQAGVKAYIRYEICLGHDDTTTHTHPARRSVSFPNPKTASLCQFRANSVSTMTSVAVVRVFYRVHTISS